MANREQFRCAACAHVGPLDVHGACELCHSQDVTSLEALAVLASYDHAITLSKTPHASR